jgi:2-C-methyl-D-erythritol 4-phosphate cytidylyltransferase/2-C-methyl-D-erythritol 2,4-cyclodiphosphate synthase
MHVAAIIVAAGKGERVGAAEPKQFLDLGGGRTMVAMSIEAFLSSPHVDELIVAVPPGFVDRIASDVRVRVVEGGARRQDSMANAFASVSPAADVVLVHDAARPFVTARLIAATIDAAREHGAAIAALPVRDTVKRAIVAGGGRRIAETLPRDDIFLAQTPQAFRRDVLEAALAAAEGIDVTDEAMLVERAGMPVYIVPGDAENVKITTREEVMKARHAGTMRVGTGYDLHRLVPGRPLILAGVRIPFELGLQGHSDADIVSHAVTDAILGATAAGDIGQLFPDTDARWKDADSLQLLAAAVEVVEQEGLRVVNVDVTVIAERPKLRPYIDEMRVKLAQALGVEVAAVSIKGKTNEAVDATGRGEAMACHAVALVTTA